MKRDYTTPVAAVCSVVSAEIIAASVPVWRLYVICLCFNTFCGFWALALYIGFCHHKKVIAFGKLQ